MDDIRAVNDAEHRMDRSGEEHYCTRCEKVEWVRGGAATEMGPCWPKHATRFVAMIAVAAWIAIIAIALLGRR